MYNKSERNLNLMIHVTVLKKEAVDGLNIKPNGIYVDGTFGGGGHSKEILNRLKDGKLFAFDQDQFALDYARNNLTEDPRVTFIHANFKDLKHELHQLGIRKIDGILLDLGLSSFQIDDASRGFSYIKNAELDMRMDRTQPLSAKHIINTYSEAELSRIFYVYGEEKNSRKIASKIISKRPLHTTSDLVEVCDEVNYKQKGHSAKRIFQALRIAVNGELDALEKVLNDAHDMLNPGGRYAIITFHSLEDRIVKHFFKENSEMNIPKNLPILPVDLTTLKIINKKPIYPLAEEITKNSRSKSAKLRIAERK